MLRFSCPYCRKILSAPPQKARTVVRCPGCKRSMKVPSPAACQPTPKPKTAGQTAKPKRPRSLWLVALPVGFVLIGALALALVYANDRFGLTGAARKDGSQPIAEISAKSTAGKAPDELKTEQGKSPNNVEPVSIPGTKNNDPLPGQKDGVADTSSQEPELPKIVETPPVKKIVPPKKPEPPKKNTQPPAKKVEPHNNPVSPPKTKPNPPKKKVEPPKTPSPPPKTKPDPPKKTIDPPKKPVSRSIAELKATLTEIEKAPTGIKDATKRERIAALNRLKAYRYLAGLPYKHIVLDDEMNKYSEAAADICKRLRTLSHNPKNPGLPKAQYEIALKGCKSSNLFGGTQATMPKSVDFYMFDSDQFNIAKLGHRRWCLSPYMGKTGFGRAGSFCAMWTFDRSYNKPLKLDAIRFPPEGYMPIEYFSANHAWSVTLNPQKFRTPDKSVKISMFPVDKSGAKSGNSIKINYKNVDKLGFGIIRNCIVFRPVKSAVGLGRRVQVEIEGLRLLAGQAHVMRYQVKFVRLQ